MKLYLASPFFNETELNYVKAAEEILRKRGYEVFSPREQEIRTGYNGWDEDCFVGDINGILNSDAVVLLYHGNYSDSGTAFECGFAYANNIPVFVVHVNDDVSNLMIHQGCAANLNWNDIIWTDFEEINYHFRFDNNLNVCHNAYKWTGDMT